KRIRLFTIGGERKGKSNDVGADYEYLSTADSELEVRFPAKAGSRVLEVTYLKDTIKPENGPGGRIRGSAVDGLETVTISGPYNPTSLGDTPSRVKILTCHPSAASEEEPCAAKILFAVARRAFRRPVRDEDVRPFLKLYKVGRATSGFEAGIRTALQGILVDPEFLYRIEHDPPNSAPDTAYRISDVELASRLSFFLWSSIPDDELLNLAE